MKKDNEKDRLKNIPAGAYTTALMFGRGYIYRMALRMLWGFRRDFFFIWRRFGWKSAYSFLYTKLFVPVGEGAGSGIYFLFGPIVRKWPRLAPFPRYVELEHTTICNKRCIMCEHTFWQDQEERHTSFDDFKGMVDQFEGIRWLHLTGEGSSFLNPEFPRMMEYASKNKKVALYMVDHLSDIGEKELRHMIDVGLCGLYVSIDAATEETYKKIRRGCIWENLQSNLRRLIELKKKLNSPIPEIVLRFVVLKENYHEIPAFLDMVAEFATPENRRWVGSGGIRIEFIGNLEFKDTENQSIYRIPTELLQEVVDKTHQYDFSTLFFHTEMDKLPEIEQCYAWLEPYIMDGGYVLPCCCVLMSNRRAELRKFAFGNLHDKTMKEIWDSERYQRFRRYVNDPTKPIPSFCTMCRSFAHQDRLKRNGNDMDT